MKIAKQLKACRGELFEIYLRPPMTTERPKILRRTKKFCHFLPAFLHHSYTGHTAGNTFQQFAKRSCFFELVFQNKTSHNYFPKYFVMDLRKDPVCIHPIRSEIFCYLTDNHIKQQGVGYNQNVPSFQSINTSSKHIKLVLQSVV